MTRYTVIGNTSIDDLVFADGTTRWMIPGGNAIYAGLGIAVWGERPAVIAVVGPEYPLDDLEGRIDLSGSRAHPVNLRNWGLYEDDGSRHFIFRRRTQNWIEFCPDVADLPQGPLDCCHLAPLPWQRQLDLARAARARGARVITVDVDDRRLTEVAEAELVEMLGVIDAFLPSRQDAETLFPTLSPADAVWRLRRMAPATPVIGVKLGADGAIVHAAGSPGLLRVPAVAVDAVDATGGGDAFCGGFLVGFARTGDAAQAVAMASVSASFAVAGIGTSGMLGISPETAATRLAALLPRIRSINREDARRAD